MTHAIGRFLAVGLLMAPSFAHADNAASTAAVVAAATAGAAAGTAASSAANTYSSAFLRELKDWKDPSTDTTASLTRQCEAIAEARLVGGSWSNGFLFGMRNDAKSARYIRPQEIRIRFPDGRERLAEFSANAQPIEVRAGWSVAGGVEAPKKSDFKDQAAVELRVPVYADLQLSAPPCVISIKIDRDTSHPQDERSYVQYNASELTLAFGSSLVRNGGSHDLGSVPAFSMAVDFYHFPVVHHGYFISLIIDSFGGGNSTLLQPVTNLASGANPQLVGLPLAAGYTYRHLLGETSALSIDVGPALYMYSYKKASDENDSAAAFATLLRLNLDHVFARTPCGFGRASHSIGLSLYDIWIPSANIGGIPAGGNTVGAMLRYKLGD